MIKKAKGCGCIALIVPWIVIAALIFWISAPDPASTAVPAPLSGRIGISVLGGLIGTGVLYVTIFRWIFGGRDEY